MQVTSARLKNQMKENYKAPSEICLSQECNPTRRNVCICSCPKMSQVSDL